MQEEEKYEAEVRRKRINFAIGEKAHADFQIRLDYEGMNQSRFLRWVIYNFIRQTDLVEDLVEEYKNQHLKKTKVSERNREEIKKKTQRVKKDFNLSQEEVESLFDIIEMDSPDL